jgi:TRAP-type C4-dicarboxylate transport system permease small subunit
MMEASGKRARPYLLCLESWAAAIAGFGVLLMMMIGGIDVILTKFFSWPVPGAYEITETLMVATVFLALAMSQREKRQIRVELFIGKLAHRKRLAIEALSELCSLALYSCIAWYGVQAAWTSVQVGEFSAGLIKLPVWPAKLALAAGAVLMCVQCAKGSIDGLRAALAPRG